MRARHVSLALTCNLALWQPTFSLPGGLPGRTRPLGGNEACGHLIVLGHDNRVVNAIVVEVDPLCRVRLDELCPAVVKQRVHDLTLHGLAVKQHTGHGRHLVATALENPAGAQVFIDAVTGKTGQEILAKHGFGKPGSTTAGASAGASTAPSQAATAEGSSTPEANKPTAETTAP